MSRYTRASREQQARAAAPPLGTAWDLAAALAHPEALRAQFSGDLGELVVQGLKDLRIAEHSIQPGEVAFLTASPIYIRTGFYSRAYLLDFFRREIPEAHTTIEILAGADPPGHFRFIVFDGARFASFRMLRVADASAADLAGLAPGGS